MSAQRAKRLRPAASAAADSAASTLAQVASAASLASLTSLAKTLDSQDKLAKFANRFHAPLCKAYFCGNSLGVQPTQVRALVLLELDKWATQGVAGHFSEQNPWASIDQTCVASMARIVGALPSEVCIMNSLTVNLHLMLASFYRPQGARNVVLMEQDAFPSDRFALNSHVASRGLDPATCVAVCEGGGTEAVLRAIAAYGERLALVMVGGVHYLTGTVLDVARISAAAHEVGALAGFDLAHAAGNVPLALHASRADFAVWCTYKYLNAGPGGLGAAFVHADHHQQEPQQRQHPRLEGWWGAKDRFAMTRAFDPADGAAAWQLSNPPVLQMAALRASLDVFDAVRDLDALFAKSRLLTAVLARALELAMPAGSYSVLTPAECRGCQLSLVFAKPVAKALHAKLVRRGYVCDEREPDVLRVAPVPLYNGFAQVCEFAPVLAQVYLECAAGDL
jgi:kynureninase